MIGGPPVAALPAGRERFAVKQHASGEVAPLDRTGYYFRSMRKPKILICSCGSSTLTIANLDSDAKGDCPICGTFGYYRRAWNARFASETTGYDKKISGGRRWKPAAKSRRRC